ncbi:hypothetical protein JXI42_04030, partial [bacterium]|nr:hypothetical protein [bacterium]
MGLTRTPKLKRRKYKGKITDDQLIRNPEFLEIPLNRTPAGSKIAALNERGMLVKEWTVPLTQRTLRLNFSQFASGIYRIVLPIKAGSSYQIRDIYYFKRNDPEFKFGFSGRALPGKYFFCPKVENLLPKRLSNYKSVEYDNLPRGESISAPPGNSSSVVVALGLFIARRMRTPVAWLALWFALFFTQTPVAFAEVRGGDKPEQRNIPSHHASPRLLTQPLTPTDSTGTDEYEWRWMAVFTDTCGVPASDEYLRWTYKVNDLPITNSTGGDTTYTITYGSEEYLCGAYSDTAYVEGGDSWIVNYRYIEGADMDSLEAKWEGVTPMGGIEFWAWDSTATRWFEIERIRGPPPMERHVNYFEVTDDSVYGNAPTHVQPRPPPDSY